MRHLSYAFLFAVVLSLSCSSEEENLTEVSTGGALEAGGEGETASAQDQTLRGTAEVGFGEKGISVEYGRPALQGRDMIGKAAPGTVWRMGLNEATTLSTETDLAFGDRKVPAGEYSLFARREGDQEWVLLVNRETGLWGAFNHDPEHDIAEIPLSVQRLEENVEVFTIELRKTGEHQGEFAMSWGTYQLTAPFTVD